MPEKIREQTLIELRSGRLHFDEVEAKPMPKDAKVECTIEGEPKGSVTEAPSNTFEYTAANKGEAILTFKMPKYPGVSEIVLKVKVKE
jgi:hypothetical protein